MEKQLKLASPRPWHEWSAIGFLALWLGLMFFRFFTVFVDANLMDHYAFRQTQVATVARELAEGGPWFPYLMPVLGPPWTVPMEFPVYQILVGWITNVTGLPLEISARLLSLISGAASLVLIYRITTLLEFDGLTKLFILIVTGLSPVFMYWSSAVMIEVFSVALCLGFVACAIEYLKNQKLALLPLGMVLAILAGLAKATTFLIFAISLFAVFGVLFLQRARKELERFDLPAILRSALPWFAYGCALLLPAIVLTQAWVNYSDSVKAASPLTAFTTSEALHDWNYGSYGDFKDAMGYLATPFRGNFNPILEQMYGAFWVLLIALALVGTHLSKRNRISFAVLIGLAILPPFIFSNLYEVHYYYWVANMVFFTSALAIGLAGLVNSISAPTELSQFGWTRSIKPAMGFAVMMLVAIGTQTTLNSAFLERSRTTSETFPSLGAAIAAATSADDIVYTFGHDWEPVLNYYSGRKMVMAKDQTGALEFGIAQDLNPKLTVFCGRAKDETEMAKIFSHPLLSEKEWRPIETERFCAIYERVGN